MFLYSAKKMRVKEQEPNSVLKPLTNSLSPSEKSKGVRFNSAIKAGIQIIKQGRTMIINIVEPEKEKEPKSKEEKRITIKKIQK